MKGIGLPPRHNGSRPLFSCSSSDSRPYDYAPLLFTQLHASCEEKRQPPLVIAQEVGWLSGKNMRAAGLFQARIRTAAEGRARFQWTKSESWRDWARFSHGCYLLRSNVTDWTPEELLEGLHSTDRRRGCVAYPQGRSTDSAGVAPEGRSGSRTHSGRLLVCVRWKTLAQRALALGK
jgi:hypothetical protein